MAAWRAELTTKEQVLAFYENSPIVKYKVYAGNKPDDNCMRFEYEGDEKQEALHELRKACDFILANPSNINSYTLQLIRSDKVFKIGEHKAAKRVQDAINIVFQLNGVEGSIIPFAQRSIGAVDSELGAIIKNQSEQLNVLISLMTAQISANNEEIDEDEEQSIGSIGERLLEPVLQVFDSPILQTALAEKISGWLLPNRQPVAMAGIEADENEKLIKQAVETLKKYDANLGADLMKLAEIAQRDIGQFNMLITVLRGQ